MPGRHGVRERDLPMPDRPDGLHQRLHQSVDRSGELRRMWNHVHRGLRLGSVCRDLSGRQRPVRHHLHQSADRSEQLRRLRHRLPRGRELHQRGVQLPVG